MSQANQSILTELKASGRLPSPTGVALTILELTRDPDTSTEDMGLVLQGDPALTGQVLKYANSADSGSRTGITSINDALVRLGMSLVRQLCLGFSVLSNARSGPCPTFDYQRYWTWSLAIGVSCQAISKRATSVTPEEGFTCGLLSQIGALGLASVYPTEYGEIISDWKNGAKEDLLARELNAFSITQHQVTSAIFEDWRLPVFYQEAALRQDDLEWIKDAEESQARHLSQVLNTACLAADICLETGPERNLLVLEFMAKGEEFGIGEEAWIDMYNEILAEWARMGQVLGVLTSSVPAMEDLVRRAKAYDKPIKSKRSMPHTDGSPEVAAEQDDEPTDGPAPVEGINILIATDSDVDRTILEKKLTEEGHRVTCASDGREALEIALQAGPQLIIADWVMPEMDGMELCRTLRSSEGTKHTYFIIMTTNDSNDQLVEGFESGINDYVIKPLNHRILAARLRGASQVIRLREQALVDREQIRKQMGELGKANRRAELALKAKDAAYLEMEAMAKTDQLTQLPNRRAGLEFLEKEWSRSSRSGESIMVLLLDIDHFKSVNDTYGHDAGDEVLRRTSVVLQDTMRDYDLVCRFGGEEFLVICPGAGVKDTVGLGNRIRQAVEGNIIDSPMFQGNVTISIGVAARDEEHDGPDDLIKQSDEALYEAKKAGRNKVCCIV